MFAFLSVYFSTCAYCTVGSYALLSGADPGFEVWEKPKLDFCGVFWHGPEFSYFGGAKPCWSPSILKEVHIIGYYMFIVCQMQLIGKQLTISIGILKVEWRN